MDDINESFYINVNLIPIYLCFTMKLCWRWVHGWNHFGEWNEIKWTITLHPCFRISSFKLISCRLDFTHETSFIIHVGKLIEIVVFIYKIHFKQSEFHTCDKFCEIYFIYMVQFIGVINFNHMCWLYILVPCMMMNLAVFN